MTEPPTRARRQLQYGGPRLRALRVMLGYRTPAAFAEHLGIAGLGESVIKDIEAPGRTRMLWDYEAAAIASAVGVHPSYFTAPLSHLGDTRRRG